MTDAEIVKWTNDWNADADKWGGWNFPLPLMAAIANLTPEQRCQLGLLFCPHCGEIELASNECGCQCWNDD